MQKYSFSLSKKYISTKFLQKSSIFPFNSKLEAELLQIDAYLQHSTYRQSA